MAEPAKNTPDTAATLLARAYLLILSWPVPAENEGKPPAEKTAEKAAHTADNPVPQARKP